MTIDRDQNTRFELNFADGPPLTAYELSNYLYNLKVLYAYFADDFLVEHFFSMDDILSDAPFIQEAARNSIRTANLRAGYPRYNYFSRNLGNRDLQIVSVSQESPTRIVLLGIAVALAIAVILGGGHISVGFTEVEADLLLPLGESLQRLKEVF